MTEWDWNRIYTKKEIAEIIFPQLSQKYAWNLISELCEKQVNITNITIITLQFQFFQTWPLLCKQRFLIYI